MSTVKKKRLPKASSAIREAAVEALSTGQLVGPERTVRQRNRPNMADVAQLAGCSQSTVSIILNNTPGVKIGDSTRERIINAARELNYSIPEKRSSNGGRTRPIAFVVDRLATSIEAIWSVEGAREAMWPTGQLLLVAQTLDDPDMEARTLDHFFSQDLEGVIYATNHTRKVVLPKLLYQYERPIVLLNCYSEDSAFPSVVPSEIAAGHSATDRLIEAGHKRIATITGEMWMEAAANRLTGYRRALATADIPYDAKLVREGNWQVNSGYQQTKVLMDLPRPPTAIFCASDRMAVGCYDALKERGLSVPRDISIIGFDNEEVSQHLLPKLTTLELPQREMGRWAVANILSPAPASMGSHRVVKLECPLIERGSVATLKGSSLVQ